MKSGVYVLLKCCWKPSLAFCLSCSIFSLGFQSSAKVWSLSSCSIGRISSCTNSETSWWYFLALGPNDSGLTAIGPILGADDFDFDFSCFWANFQPRSAKNFAAFPASAAFLPLACSTRIKLN